MAGVCLMLISTGMVQVADAASVSALRSRMRSVDSRRANLKQTLRELKSDQAAAHRKLAAATSDLAASRARLKRAKARLAEVQQSLRNIKAEQERTLADLEEHKSAMSDRILAMWRSEQNSYFEVMLESTSFEDFSNRAEFTKLVADQDEEMLDGLAELRDRLASQRATMEIKMREADQLTTRIAQDTALVEQRTRAARALSQAADADRAKAERRYAQELDARKAIEALIREAQRGGSSSASRYSGSSDGRFMRPVNGRLTSPFGYRIHPVWHTRRFHNGIDLAAPRGTPIRAAAAGKVIFAGWKGAYGKCVIIDHGSGWSTMYGHASSLNCSRGQVVSKGQTISRVGTTGTSTGNHLHWTVYHNGKAVNPLSHS